MKIFIIFLINTTLYSQYLNIISPKSGSSINDEIFLEWTYGKLDGNVEIQWKKSKTSKWKRIDEIGVAEVSYYWILPKELLNNKTDNIDIRIVSQSNSWANDVVTIGFNINKRNYSNQNSNNSNQNISTNNVSTNNSNDMYVGIMSIYCLYIIILGLLPRG
tara:strand:+ start:577 stop:1059 length:483 start_codon:yes stop_codon:yes gene_type:complete